jgi:glycerate dehydrogenase
MNIAILDSFTTDQGNTDVWNELRQFGNLKVHPRTSPEETAARCAEADIVFTNKVTLNDGNLGLKTRYIGVLATGTNVVDLEAAKKRGIAVTNIPGYSTESVAQLVFAVLLQFTHDVAGHNADVKAGKWAACPDFFFMRQNLTELHRKTLVVIGSGAIGGAVSRIAKAFGMHVIAAQVPGSSRTLDRMPLEEALRHADAVTLHCPLTEQTRNLVDRKFLALLKPSTILINTGRGPLLHEEDLMAALDQGLLGGVGLDVLSKEPPLKDHPLLNPDAKWAHKVVVTPHLGWATVEARQRLVEMAVANLKAFLNNESLNRVA